MRRLPDEVCEINDIGRLHDADLVGKMGKIGVVMAVDGSCAWKSTFVDGEENGMSIGGGSESRSSSVSCVTTLW